jgi:hypothetical protein
MSEETTVAGKTHEGSRPIEKSCSKEKDTCHGELEKGPFAERLGDARTTFNRAARFLTASWITWAIAFFCYIQSYPELSTPLRVISQFVSV